MVSLVLWLKAHKEQLIVVSLQELSAREPMRAAAEGPVRWFYDSVIEAISKDDHKRLEALLQNWVKMCAIPINGQPVGLLPVLGVFRTALWEIFQREPPSENPLALAAQLEATIGKAAEFLSKVEAAALLDALTHQLAAQPEAEQSNLENAKETFVSIAAHELKTPLTVIEGYANMLKVELPEASHPREALMIRGIESGVVRLREFVEDLVDVSLIEVDLLTLDVQPVWLRRLLDILDTELRDTIKARKLTLDIKQETIPARPLMADPERLLKALKKIVSNAIKYTPDGGRITIFGRGLNGFVDMVVEDTGIGIPPDSLDTIFQKFAMLGNPNLHSSGKVKFKGGGAGLGLVIAKGIIQAHGGNIWAESSGADEAKMPGSRFHLMLPADHVVTGAVTTPAVAGSAKVPAEIPTVSSEVLPVSATSQDPVSAGENRALPVRPSDRPASTVGQTLEQESSKDSTGRLSS